MNSMNLPADLSPATCTWLRVQMTIASARAVEPLRAEIKRVDDFTNGLFLVIAQVLPHILIEQPALAAKLAPHWRLDAQRFDALEAGATPKDDDESLDLLEARSILYNMGLDLTLWPTTKQKGSVRAVPRVRRA